MVVGAGEGEEEEEEEDAGEGATPWREEVDPRR